MTVLRKMKNPIHNLIFLSSTYTHTSNQNHFVDKKATREYNKHKLVRTFGTAVFICVSYCSKLKKKLIIAIKPTPISDLPINAGQLVCVTTTSKEIDRKRSEPSSKDLTRTWMSIISSSPVNAHWFTDTLVFNSLYVDLPIITSST